MLQTTNGNGAGGESRSGKKIPQLHGCAGSTPASGTTDGGRNVIEVRELLDAVAATLQACRLGSHIIRALSGRVGWSPLGPRCLSGIKAALSSSPGTTLRFVGRLPRFGLAIFWICDEIGRERRRLTLHLRGRVYGFVLTDIAVPLKVIAVRVVIGHPVCPKGVVIQR